MEMTYEIFKPSSSGKSKFMSAFATLTMAVFLVGCSSDNGGMSGFGISDMKWFNSSEPSSEESFQVGDSSSFSSTGNGKALVIQNAIELAEQKRFVEARILLGELRDIQHRESDGYRALSTSMALLAMREGDIVAFKRISRQLDASLGNSVRVPPAYTEVVSLYRAMNQQSLPVNAPENFQRMRDKLLPVETAGLRKGSQ
jgi:hypothetical protein